MLVDARKLPEIKSVDMEVQPGMEMHADALLQASRRVDWRFLLPDPELGDVAFIGSSDELHIKALNAFSKSLAVFARPPSGGEQNTKYDIVVVCAPSLPMLANAGDLLNHGGFLYVETYGLLWLSRLRRSALRSGLGRLKVHPPRQYWAALGGHRLIPIGSFWHWPDFENCTRIVPMDTLSGYELAFNDPLSQWRSNLVGWSLRNGIAGQLGPCISYVAQRVIE